MAIKKNKNYMFILALSAPIIPLILISIAILISPWFSITDNALSDLGHAIKSDAAWIFNLGLALGGMLFLGIGFYLFSKESVKMINANIILIGLFMDFVGVFDEVYGKLHFIVSLLLFLSFASFLILYGWNYKKILPVIAAIVGFIPWVIQGMYNIPRGVAIPELISVFLTLPWYYFYIIHVFSPLNTKKISRTNNYNQK